MKPFLRWEFSLVDGKIRNDTINWPVLKGDLKFNRLYWRQWSVMKCFYVKYIAEAMSLGQISNKARDLSKVQKQIWFLVKICQLSPIVSPGRLTNLLCSHLFFKSTNILGAAAQNSVQPSWPTSFFSIRPTHWFGSLTRIPSPYKMISNILNLNQKGNFKNFDHFHREYIFAVPPVFAAPEPLRVLRRAERDPPVPWESTQCAAQCPGRAHSTVPVHFGRAAADRQSTLPGPFLTCVVSHCCLIGKYFDLRSSLCNANMPF